MIGAHSPRKVIVHMGISMVFKHDDITHLCLAGERGGQLAAQFAKEDGSDSDQATSHDEDDSIISD